MVALSLPFRVPVWQITTGVVSSTLPNSHPRTKPRPNTAQPPSTGPTTRSRVDQALFKDQHVIGDGRASRRSDSGEKADQALMMERLERVAEGMREMELEKLMRGARGQVSDEERVLMERMSREIVGQFMEKPIQYLKSDADMEEKLKDLNLLAAILEESYFGMQEKRCPCLNPRRL